MSLSSPQTVCGCRCKTLTCNYINSFLRHSGGDAVVEVIHLATWQTDIQSVAQPMLKNIVLLFLWVIYGELSTPEWSLRSDDGQHCVSKVILRLHEFTTRNCKSVFCFSCVLYGWKTFTLFPPSLHLFSLVNGAAAATAWIWAATHGSNYAHKTEYVPKQKIIKRNVFSILIVSFTLFFFFTFLLIKNNHCTSIFRQTLFK